MKGSLAFFLAGTIAASAAAPAGLSGSGLQQTFNGEHIKATVFIPGETVPRFGFIPVRLTTANQQPRELQWRLGFDLNSQSGYGAGSVTRSAVTLTIPPSHTGERWIFVPTGDAGWTRNVGGYGGNWANLALTVEGTAIRDVQFNFNTSGRSNSVMVPWAVSASLENAVRSHLVGLKAEPAPAATPAARPGFRRPAPAGPQPLIRGAPNLFVFDPAQSLGDWRVWTPFTRVVIGADEFATLAPPNRVALRNWVALGGMLYVVPAGASNGSRENLGAGLIATLRQPVSPTGAHDSDGLFTAGPIFSPSFAIPSDLSLQKGGLADRVPPAKRVGDWLVYFFVGFAVLVAPVNLFAIAPVKRRHWLFISVPAISLAAVGVLVGAIYLQDGIGGDGARRALVVLLPGDNQAAVFQEQVARTGLLFGTSFPLDDDTICSAVAAEDTNVQAGRGLEYVRQDGRARGDWFRGRARQAQQLRRLTPTRARVEQVGTAPDGAPIVQSSFGAALRDFSFIDETGTNWRSNLIAPGTRVTLTRANSTEDYTRLVREFESLGTSHFGGIVAASAGIRLEQFTPGLPGRFVAAADDSELAPLPTLAAIRWKDSRVLLTGVLENTAGRKAAP